MNIGIQWRVMLSLGMIMPAIMIFLVLNIMPETPRWLVKEGREGEAKVVLEQVYPPNYPVGEIIDDIKEALERERMAEHALGWNVIYSPTPAFRRMLFVGVGTAIAQQAVGIDALQYYLVDVLDTAGVKDETEQSLLLILLGVVKLVFILVGGKFFDSRGRRPLFFTSLLGKCCPL
jgi:MFS family permease